MYKDVFEARFENLCECIEKAQSYLSSQGIQEQTASICMLALNEALNNVVEHSYADAASGDIELYISVERKNIRFQVKDRGMSPPEDLFSVKDRLPDPFDLPEGGWGLALIDTVMDDVGYCCKDGVNQLELVKRIEPCFS